MSMPTGYPKVIALIRTTETASIQIYRDQNYQIITKSKAQLLKEVYEKFGANNYAIYEAVEVIKDHPTAIT